MTDNIFIPEILEKENCRIVVNKDFLELTRITEVEGAEFSASETRYHNLIENVRIEDFDFLWLNSWLWEECEVRGDYEVVINRKHNEIVLGKATRTIYDYEGELKEAVTWEHKYLPFYPYISTQDLIDQFEQFWELEPYVMSARAVPTGDYEIAGQVLEDSLDLGEGYENIFFNKPVSSKPTTIEANVVENKISISGYTTDTSQRVKVRLGDKVEAGEKFYINVKIIKNTSNIKAKDILLDNSKLTILKETADNFISESVVTAGNNNVTNIAFISNIFFQTNTKFEGEFEAEVFITKTSEPKPFIKNSRPDSKLALPQLSTLGAITSTEMRGNHLVAQHENGTAIIKNAVINPNAPLSSLHWGLQAYKDASGNKRLFCSTADGTYPVGWENIKYDSDGVFYDVARNSTSNNIAGLITEEEGKLKVYIGEGYQNLNNVKSFGASFTQIDANTFEVTSTYSSEEGGIYLSNSNLEQNATYSVKYKIISGYENLSSVFASTIRTNSSYTSTEQEGEVTFTTNDNSDGGGVFEVKLKPYGKLTCRLQITKTSTPKPFITGIVPSGALKVACDWNLNTHSFILKGISRKDMSNNYIPITSTTGGHQGVNFNIFFSSNSLVNLQNTNMIASKISNGIEQDNYKTKMNEEYSLKPSGGFINFIRNPYNQSVDCLIQILIYNNPKLTQAEMEGELAKDIYLPAYHHQPNSVINTYGITGASAMLFYSPALTEAEVIEECEKNIELKEIGDITIGLETIKGVLVYDGEVVEEDIAKDINPKPYHWQDNSIINKYKVKGFSRMYTYKPELTDAEIAEEVNKNVYLPKTHWNIPNHLGIVN